MKLAIEIVPKTCWFSNVRNHVTKTQWDTIRKTVFQKAGDRCEICGGRGAKWPVECHEIFEYNDEIHLQTLAGLIALCPDCHEVKHFGLARVKGTDKQAMWHLCEVNEWTIEQGVDHANAQLKIARSRSEHEWSVDLSYLHTVFGLTITEESGSKRAQYGKRHRRYLKDLATLSPIHPPFLYVLIHLCLLHSGIGLCVSC